MTDVEGTTLLYGHIFRTSIQGLNCSAKLAKINYNLAQIAFSLGL